MPGLANKYFPVYQKDRRILFYTSCSLTRVQHPTKSRVGRAKTSKKIKPLIGTTLNQYIQNLLHQHRTAEELHKEG